MNLKNVNPNSKYCSKQFKLYQTSSFFKLYKPSSKSKNVSKFSRKCCNCL